MIFIMFNPNKYQMFNRSRLVHLRHKRDKTLLILLILKLLTK